MIEKISLNHVAVLVPSVRKAADSLRKFDFQIGKEEVFEGEGTKEIYVEREKGNSLLLLEPTKNGPYQRALEKRGPGIHHIAIDVLDLDAFLVSLSGSGWLLHPKSAVTISKYRTAWLARPGFPGLVEVQEQKEFIEHPLFVERIFLEMDPVNSRLLKAVGVESVVQISEGRTEMILSGIRIGIEHLIGGVMDSVAKTSLLTAAMRAVESQRSGDQGRLFQDPFADQLAGSEGKRLLQKAIEESGDQPAIAIRTAFMDERIKFHFDQGIRQFVFLAAGMDTRAYRLNLAEDAVIYELDRPEVLEYKNNILRLASPTCKRQTIGVDLQQEWAEPLLGVGFDPGKPTLLLIEGLLMYLDEVQVRTLLGRVNSLTSPDDVLLFDVVTKSLLESPQMQAQLKFLAKLGAPWRFGTNEPEIFMKDLGWKATATQPGEFAPHRWPFPTLPRSVPNVPRGYYIEATRVVGK